MYQSLQPIRIQSSRPHYSVWHPYVGLVLLQDHMTGELWFGDGREASDDHQQSLETR